MRNRRVEPEVDRGPHRRVDAHAGHHPADDELVHAGRAQLGLELGLAKAVRMLFRDHRLAVEWSDALVNLHAVGARAHERGVLLVPDVPHVEDRVARRTEAGKEPRG